MPDLFDTRENYELKDPNLKLPYQRSDAALWIPPKPTQTQAETSVTTMSLSDFGVPQIFRALRPPPISKQKSVKEILAMQTEEEKKKRLQSIEAFRKTYNDMVIAFGQMDDPTIDAMRAIRTGINTLEESVLLGNPKTPVPAVVTRDDIVRR